MAACARLHSTSIRWLWKSSVCRQFEKKAKLTPAGRVRPAIGGAHAAMPEGARMGDGAEAAHDRDFAARMRPDAAVHRQAHVFVDAVAGEVAGDEFDHPRRQHARAAQLPALRQHLVEGRHAARRAVAAAARDARGAAGHRVLRHARGELAVHRRVVDVRGAALLRFRQTDEDLVGQAERRDDPLGDELAEILAGDGLDQHRRGPVRRGRVVLHLAAGGPFQAEVARPSAAAAHGRPSRPPAPRRRGSRPGGSAVAAR